MINRKNEIFNVAVIGAGQIGAFYDQPDSDNILTHGHAFSVHPGYKLLGFFDKDYRQAERAASLWGGEAFSDLNQLRSDHSIDMICLAVPDEQHYDYLRELLKWDIKLIFAEKPLVQTIEQAEEISRLFNKSPIFLGLNYSRRFLPEIIKLREDIQKGLFGCFMTGTGYYGKGLLHNGSHMLDLLRYLLGDMHPVLKLQHIDDFYKDDPTVSVVLELERGGRFIMQGVDCRAFTMFEMDLIFAGRRIRIEDTGFSIVEYEVRDNPVFTAYRNIVKTSEVATSMGRALYYAADNIYKHLTKGSSLCCRLEDGCKVIALCHEINASLAV